ncbi:DNA primase [Kytococcus aerolatus]|uniref:DNA primase n=1 Tax=Kytococcus aerolatus TaxID=592308 RepID=A0A212U2U7_9MICO|nr:DNA primase [Kytococcus aerolatus]SNC72446.1 DNA primase [Kytococcus aerolatus]
MAGLIRSEDIQLVKEKASLEEVVREHVTLRTAGVGSLKGLCPFHDEKTPSFHVRPAVGHWHCFGCGEGGDVIEFVQRVDHLSFTEAVERLAASVGHELRYEEGSGPRREGGLGKRARLVEAHRAAEEFYHQALLRDRDARPGRDFLRSKGFTGKDSAHFMVGFAPRTGTALYEHLRAGGFTDEELLTAGLAGRSGRGMYDRFRGRVMWPIRDITGDTIGFGARRIFEDDRIAAKYLNTSETPIYTKNQVLYGLDLAKRSMARGRRAVVVEGYTDVMAAHLAGVDVAVATCGTAFGAEHIKVLRRILRDEADRAPARVVFTFDGDAAGQKAAMKAFAADQAWASQSYVAVAPEGMDPNDLRLRHGDLAVRQLVEDAIPMFEFAVRTSIERYELGTPEGRVGAMRAAAPIIAGIRDRSLQPEYQRTVAGWIGVDVDALAREVRNAPRGGTAAQVEHEREAQRRRAGESPAAEPAASQGPPPLPPVNPRNPDHTAERQLLQVALQYPRAVVEADFGNLTASAYSAPALALVHEAILAAGGIERAVTLSHGAWVQQVRDHADPRVGELVGELAVADLPVRMVNGLPVEGYVRGLVARLRIVELNSRIAGAMGELTRLGDEDPAQARELALRLQGWQRELQLLRAAR